VAGDLSISLAIDEPLSEWAAFLQGVHAGEFNLEQVQADHATPGHAAAG
jgi:hypothetical protein